MDFDFTSLGCGLGLSVHCIKELDFADRREIYISSFFLPTPPKARECLEQNSQFCIVFRYRSQQYQENVQ